MKKLTLEEFKVKVVKAWGDMYTVVSKHYEGSKKDMIFGCKKHGEFIRTPNALIDKKCGCPQCGPGSGGKNKLSAGTVLAELKLKFPTFEFPEFLENYRDTQYKVRVVCPTHGEFSIRPASLRLANGGCPSCNIEEGTKNKRITSSEYLARVKHEHQNKYDYSLTNYTRMIDNITVVCPKHGSFSQQAGVHLKHGCARCSSDERAAASKVPFEEFVQRSRLVHGIRYTYDETSYSSMTTPTTICCTEHGKFIQKAADHLHNEAGCPKCGNQMSKGELELKEYLTEIGVEHIPNYKYSGRKEVDAFIPSLNIAIEYDGLPWHSTKFRTRAEQTSKVKELAALGVKLVRVFEDEWRDRNKQVKSLLSSRLGTNKQKIYARTCSVIDVTNEQAREFYNEHHIQGWKRSGTNKGLMYLGKLVALMTFSTCLSDRNGTEDTNHLELARFASSVQVVGGASRLLKALIRYTGAKKITSYSDNRLFSGAMYSRLGFLQVEPVPANYTYWKNNTKIRQHKSKFQHKHLENLLENYNPQLTEKQNCENNDYYQIYDDGLTKWELTV